MKKNAQYVAAPKEFARFLKHFRSPRKIQDFLDTLKYNTEDRVRCPVNVWKDRKAHCFDGAMFAAAALRAQGFPALLLDLRSYNDDDHVLALYRKHGAWGTLGKSNYSGLQFREPIYRNLRELAMSFFDIYFNLARQKSLREYSVPFDMKRVDHLHWVTSDEHLDDIATILDGTRHYNLITPAMAKGLSKADDRVFRSITSGLDPKGAYKL